MNEQGDQPKPGGEPKQTSARAGNRDALRAGAEGQATTSARPGGRGLAPGGALTAALVIVAVAGALAACQPGPSTARPAATATPNILDQGLASAVVYVATISGPEDYLYAVNARAGKILRRSTFDDRGHGATLTSSGSAIYIGSGDGAVTQLDAATGRQLWVSNDPHAVKPYVTVAGSLVYVNDAAAITYALNATTGKLIWLHDSGLNAHLNPVNNNFIEVCGWPPTVAGGLVYQSTTIPKAGTGRLYALDAATGAVHWQVALGAPAASPPRVSAGTLYVAMNDGSMAAYHATTGAKMWSAHLTTVSLNGGLALAGNIVYGMGTDGALYAATATTGAPVAIAWHTAPTAPGAQFHDSGFNVYTPPLSVVDGTVYDGWAGGFLTALKGSDGSLLWQYDDAHGNPDSGPSSPPIVFDGAVFFTDRDGNLTALRATDGKLAWRIAPGGDTPTSPAIAA